MTEEYLRDLIKSEGNSKEWAYKCKNGLEFKCLITRPSNQKEYIDELLPIYLCGYVYFDESVDISKILVHGGITYTDKDMIGFDCAHASDIKFLSQVRDPRLVYRDMEYVTENCHSLAEQLSKLSKKKLRNHKIDGILN